VLKKTLNRASVTRFGKTFRRQGISLSDVYRGKKTVLVALATKSLKAAG